MTGLAPVVGATPLSASKFSVLLLNLLDPSRTGHGKQLLDLFQHSGRNGAGIEVGKLSGVLLRRAQEVEGVALDASDVVLGLPTLPGSRAEIAVEPGDQGSKQQAVHLVGGLRGHPNFLSVLRRLAGSEDRLPFVLGRTDEVTR